MKFVLTDDYRYRWPVTVRVPDPQKPGAFVEQTFEAEFRAMSEKRAREIDTAYAALERPEERAAHQHDVLREILTGWSGVEGEKGKDVPFSPKTLELALQFQMFRTAVYEAYAASMRGDGVRLKN